MKILRHLLLLIFTCFVCSSFAQKTNVDWTKWKPLLGEWVGEGNGQPGSGNGSFSFNFDLDKNIIVRKSHTEFPATNDSKAFSHDDMLIVYSDNSEMPSKADYFDNEGHHINYVITYAAESIIFTSEKVANSPGFRLSYIIIDEKTVNVKFEMSSPQKPEEFKLYLEGKSKRIN